MIRKLLSATCLAFVASSMALADPPPGKGKPDKGGGDYPPGPIEVIFDWVDSNADDTLGISAVNGTNYHTIIQGSQVSTFGLVDVSPVANEALVNDYGRVYLIGWSYNASGGIGSTSSELVVSNLGSAVSCTAFSKDGSRILYSLYAPTLWSVPTNAVSTSPTLEYTLPTGQRFGACDYDLDGTVVAEVITDGPNGNNQARLSRFSLGAGGAETVLVANGLTDWIRSVDIGPSGGLAYSLRTGDTWVQFYEQAGQTKELQNAYGAVYDCEGGRIVYRSVHRRNSAKRNWLIRDLETNLTSDFPERDRTGRIDWLC